MGERQSAADAGARPSRAAAVWRRTWIGALMIAVLVALFWTLEAVGDARPILFAVAALLVVASLEVERLGAIAGRGFGLAILASTAWGLAYWLGGDVPGAHHLAHSALIVLPPGLFAFAGVCLLRRRGQDGRTGRAGILAALAAFALVIAGLPESVRGPLPWIALPLSVLVAWASVPRWQPARTTRGREVLIAMGLITWLVTPLFGLAQVYLGFSLGGLVALLLLSKVGDIAGYYTGNAIGKSHPFPGISPGKTTAGCVGSLVAGTLCGWLVVVAGLLPEAHLGVLGALFAGALINLAAQAGDLAESWVKRSAGVKDSGPWFGPAGGVLDLVDSLLFTVPAAIVLWPLFFPA